MKVKITSIKKIRYPNVTNGYKSVFRIYYKMSSGRRYNDLVNTENESIKDAIEKHMKYVKDSEKALREDSRKERKLKVEAQKIIKAIRL